MDILVRSPNWIGDCVMSLPALRALKDFMPAANIFLVAKDYLKDIFKHINEIREIITIPNSREVRNLFFASKKIREFKFDAGILLTNSFHSALLFKMAGVKNVMGYRKDLRGLMLTRSIPYPRNDRHHIYFYLDLIEKFIHQKIEKSYSHSLVVSETEKGEVRALLREWGVDLSKQLIGISTSAAYGSAKEWEPDSFRQLIINIKNQRPHTEILLFGSEGERAKISKIMDPLNTRSFNLAGRLSLRQSIAAISLCRLFVSNDSGLLHVAAALGVSGVAIFGPTLPHKTAPIGNKIKVLYYPVECAPCKYRDCPIDHRCMTSITVDEVHRAVTSLLADEA
jgi:heptosyltransferase-2